MAAGSGKIVLDADASKVVAEAKRSADALKQAAKEAAGLGGQIEKYGGQLAKTVVGVGAVARAIAAVAAEVVGLQRAAADASRKTGATALDAGLAGARLGLSGRDTAALTSGSSAKSGDEVAAFLNTLGSTKGPGKQAPNRTDTFRAVNLFKSGIFSGDEITDAIGKGSLGQLQKTAGARQALMGDAAADELEIRRQEIAAGAQADQVRAGRNGARNRLAQANRDLRGARSPVTAGIQNVVGQFTAPIGGDSIIEAGDIAFIGHKLDAQTALMRSQSDRPALAPSPDKQ